MEIEESFKIQLNTIVKNIINQRTFQIPLHRPKAINLDTRIKISFILNEDGSQLKLIISVMGNECDIC